MKKTLTILIVLTAISAAALAADWPIKFSWAFWQLNEPVEMTKLEVACLKASFDEQLGGIEFTDTETGEHIATVTAAEFMPGERSLIVKVHVEPAEGRDLPSGFALSHIGTTLSDMRLHAAGIEGPIGPGGAIVAVYHQGKRIKASRYGTQGRERSTEIRTQPHIEPALQD